MGLRTFSLSLPFLSWLPQGRKPGSAVVVLYRKTRPADAQMSVTHVHASMPADGDPNSGCNTTCRCCKSSHTFSCELPDSGLAALAGKVALACCSRLQASREHCLLNKKLTGVQRQR